MLHSLRTHALAILWQCLKVSCCVWQVCRLRHLLEDGKAREAYLAERHVSDILTDFANPAAPLPWQKVRLPTRPPGLQPNLARSISLLIRKRLLVHGTLVHSQAETHPQLTL